MTKPNEVLGLSDEHTLILRKAISSHTDSIAKGMKVGDVVRQAFIECSIDPRELLPVKHDLFTGREEVRPVIMKMILGSFSKYTVKLINMKSSDCDDSIAYLWSETHKANKEVIDKEDRTEEQRKLGYRTKWEHREIWRRQPNSRLNDYRDSLSAKLGIAVKVPKVVKATDSDATDSDAEKDVKMVGNPIAQHATNLLNSLKKNDTDLNITSMQFNALVKTLSRLSEFNVEPGHEKH